MPAISTSPQDNSAPAACIAIQGERGSNSHLAALQMLGAIEVLPCSTSPEVFAAVVEGRAAAAVLPIENSLYGSVAEHYDLLLQQPVRIAGESLLRVRHNLIAAPGVPLAAVRTILSHPVALAQCRRWLAAFPQARAVPFYDTAGSVKHLMADRLHDTAGVAPALAAEVYGATVLVPDIEDHQQNFTRFHLLRPSASAAAVLAPELAEPSASPGKLSVAFALEHRPGTLVGALQALAACGADLTRIESRPVPGSPWEYIFFVEMRLNGEARADHAIEALAPLCGMVKELGRYRAA